jgi:acyl-CoA synthetase (AMP-forming)/AMP-acid ligase II
MLGQMMQQPLLISSLIDHAAKHHPEGEIVSRRVEGDIHRTTYGQVARRSRQVAKRAGRAGLALGDRVATLAWNGYRHMELYFGVSGSGRVLHTINPRLHPDQIAWIADHAEDQVLCFDMTFLPLIKGHLEPCKTVRHWVAMTDADSCRPTPASPTCCATKTWIGRQDDHLHLAQLRREQRQQRCATPAAPPATPRACCTATAHRAACLRRRRCPTR